MSEHDDYEYDDTAPPSEPARTLRDEFAIAALTAMGTWMPDYEPDGRLVDAVKNLCNPKMHEARARWAFEQADAMLACRAKTEGGDT